MDFDRPAYDVVRYSKTKEKYAAGRAESKARRKREQYDYINQIKSGPCTDCGGRFPTVAMDFDHLGDKSFTIGEKMGAHSLDRLKEEVAKCELVCSNCHRVRTWQRRLAIVNG